MKLAFCDLTHLFIDELEPLAKKLGKENEYKEVSSKNLGVKDITQYLHLLHGMKVEEIAKEIEKAKPYEGAVEFISGIKRRNYKPIIVTDNPLLHFREVRNIIEKKLNVNDIYSTFVLTKNYDIEQYFPKEIICEKLYNRYKPRILLGVVQGENDYNMAKFVKERQGKVIGVNSDSEKIREISDYWVEETRYLPKILSAIE